MNQERAIFSRRDKLQHLVQPGESSLVLAVGGPWSLGGCPRSYLPLLGLGPVGSSDVTDHSPEHSRPLRCPVLHRTTGFYCTRFPIRVGNHHM